MCLLRRGRQSQLITSAGSKVSDLGLSIGPRLYRADLRVTNGPVCDGRGLIMGRFCAFLLISLFCPRFTSFFFCLCFFGS